MHLNGPIQRNADPRLSQLLVFKYVLKRRGWGE